MEYNEAEHQLFIDFKKVYDLVRGEVLYNILIEFGIPMKLIKLLKMCLNETETVSRLMMWNACYHSVQNLFSSSLLSKNIKIKIYRTIFACCFVCV